MQLQQFEDCRLEELMRWFPDAHACRVWGGTQFRFPFTPATFREDAKIDSLPTWMLVEAGEMVAFGQYYLRIGRCHLGRLAVTPQRRGRGIGAVLVRELCVQGAAEFGVYAGCIYMVQRAKSAAKPSM